MENICQEISFCQERKHSKPNMKMQYSEKKKKKKDIETGGFESVKKDQHKLSLT